jgi:hypothetical protein
MGKIYQYMTMLGTLEALMWIGGLNFNSTLLLALGLSPSGWTQGALILLVVATIGATALFGGIAATFFGSSPNVSYVITPIALSILSLFIVDMGAIITYIYTNSGMVWLSGILFVIGAGISVGFVMSLIQFWMGNDV